jgi:putative toxin-antitoxin system antitoxin component (TIGR02293 family)
MNVAVSRIVSALGGETVLNHRVRHELDLIAVAEAGLPIESLLFLQHNMGFTNKTMSHILAISESTYQRRIRTKAKLTKDEGEKVISLSEVYEKGIEVFENPFDFNQWLYADIASLQHQKPVDLLDSMVGRKQVMNVLNAILHGIYL